MIALLGYFDSPELSRVIYQVSLPRGTVPNLTPTPAGLQSDNTLATFEGWPLLWIN